MVETPSFVIELSLSTFIFAFREARTEWFSFRRNILIEPKLFNISEMANNFWRARQGN